MTAISMDFAVFLSLNLKSNKIKMKKILFILMAFFGLFSSQAQQAKSIHSFKVKALDGKTIDFSKFKGKKILIVNTASECGFTPQYEGLQKLYETYKDQLVIVGFPANNFGGQEPGSNEEIGAFCKKITELLFRWRLKFL